jgi:hypothetical protein
MKTEIVEILGAFISIVFGLSLETTVQQYGQAIVNDTNSSSIVKTLAPFMGVLWLIACFGIAFALIYRLFKGD